MDLTEQQAKAVTTIDKDLCVMSGAGCGKTRVLVERFLHLLDQCGASVPDIAAITFTEKAALQMKERIRKACRDRAGNGASPEDAATWEKHRRETENARIGTIHGFCTGMLREFPAESGVDPHFAVIDEGESLILLDRTVKETLRLLVEADDSAAVKLVDEFGFGRAVQMITVLFQQTDDAAEVARAIAGGNNEEIADEIRRLENELREAVLDRLTRDADWVKEIGFLAEHAAENAEDKREQARQTVLHLARELETAGSMDKRVGALRAISEVSLRGGSARNWADKTEMKAVGDNLRAVRDLALKCLVVCTPDSEEAGRRAAQVAQWVARAFLSCSDRYEQVKREQSALDFSDLLVKARDLLRDNASVRRHYQKVLKYILVDEFQDTDRLQAAIIQHLTADEAGAYTRNRLFVVGDAKQSIYKFRGADVSVFRGTEERIRKTGGIVDLDLTFRARPKIVSFVNDFFGQLIGAERKEALYEAEYADLTAHRTTISERPEVEFLLAEPADGNGTLEEMRPLEAELIARRIRWMVENQEPLVSFEEDGVEVVRPVRYGDIAILFRAMTGFPVYEKALREYEIPYYLTSGGGFYGRQEIRDIVCFLKVLENADDEIALAGVLRSPMFGLSDNALYWLKRNGKPLFESIRADHEQLSDDERDKLVNAADIVSALRAVKDRYSISRLITEIVNRTGYLWVLRTMFLGRQKAGNVRKLVEAARDFERRGVLTLRDFINYVNEFVTQEIREGEAVIEEEKSDVVKVTTIHKAKGLEYPVVFVADLSHGTANVQRPDVLVHRGGAFGLKLTTSTGGLEPTALSRLLADEDKAKDVAESKRLLYVACTRAKDYLVLSGVPGTGRQDSWMRWFESKYNLADADGEIPYGDEGYTLAVTTELDAPKPAKAGVSLARKYRKQLCAFETIPAGKGSGGIDPPKIFARTEPVKRSLGRKNRFSVTELEDYGECPRLYELKYVYEIPEAALYDVAPAVVAKRELSAAERGSVAHRVFELWAGDGEGDVRALTRWVLDQRKITEAAVRAQLADEIVSMHEQFMSHDAAARILAASDVRSELAFSLNLDGSVIEGAIDMTFVDGEGTRWVLDFKTDKVTAAQAKGHAEKYSFQLGVYALAVPRLADGSVPCASVFFLTPSVEVVLPVDRESLERVAAEAEKRIAGIRADDFHPVRDGCEHCKYIQLCDR
jgi:ATP-dependent helicase/nuclease subunit A